MTYIFGVLLYSLYALMLFASTTTGWMLLVDRLPDEKKMLVINYITSPYYL